MSLFLNQHHQSYLPLLIAIYWSRREHLLSPSLISSLTSTVSTGYTQSASRPWILVLCSLPPTPTKVATQMCLMESPCPPGIPNLCGGWPPHIPQLTP